MHSISGSMMSLVPWLLITYKALTIARKGFSRFQADSNRCERFCRPVPNHSDMEPFLLSERSFPSHLRCKVNAFFWNLQIFLAIFFKFPHIFLP